MNEALEAALLAALRGSPGRRRTVASLAHAGTCSAGDVRDVLAALAARGFPLCFADPEQVLLGPDTPLHEEELRRALRTRVIGRKIAVYGSVTSTQEVAREAVAQGAEAGLVVAAEEQRAGRGRLGRRWLSPAGRNLLFSTVLFPPSGLGAALVATFAVAVAEAVGEACGLDAGIRWPNDVLVSERKVAGILVEAVTRGGSLGTREGSSRPLGSWSSASGASSPKGTESPRRTGEEGFAVGVGVNVNASPEGVGGAGALAELVGHGGAASRPQGGHPVLPPGTGDHGLHRSSVYEGAEPAARDLDRTLLLVSLLRVLDHWYDVLVRGHIEEVEDRWRARSTILGRQVTLEREGERYRGRVVDLSVTEGIILELAPGLTQLFPPEHVTLVPEP